MIENPEPQPQPAQQSRLLEFNLNSLLMVVVIGALTWVGSKTSSNNDDLVKINATLPYMTDSVAKLDARISQLVSRAELDSRISEVKASEADDQKRISIIESRLPARQ